MNNFVGQEKTETRHGKSTESRLNADQQDHQKPGTVPAEKVLEQEEPHLSW
jgi:hypothetical protein